MQETLETKILSLGGEDPPGGGISQNMLDHTAVTASNLGGLYQ